MTDLPLRDIHSLLTESALSLQADSLDENIVIRVSATTKDAVIDICKRHGTNQSAFGRRVFEQLVNDYGGDLTAKG